MLTIRKEQTDKLGEVVERNFKINNIKHLKEKYPNETNEKDEKKMMGFIQTGIKKAEKHNIIERRDISVYLEYMLAYGEDFDTDPENEWAIKVLRIVNLRGEEKVNRLLIKKPL